MKAFRKKIRVVTFWVGVNIIGLPQFVEYRFNRKGEDLGITQLKSIA